MGAWSLGKRAETRTYTIAPSLRLGSNCHWPVDACLARQPVRIRLLCQQPLFTHAHPIGIVSPFEHVQRTKAAARIPPAVGHLSPNRVQVHLGRSQRRPQVCLGVHLDFRHFATAAQHLDGKRARLGSGGGASPARLVERRRGGGGSPGDGREHGRVANARCASCDQTPAAGSRISRSPCVGGRGGKPRAQQCAGRKRTRRSSAHSDGGREGEKRRDRGQGDHQVRQAASMREARGGREGTQGVDATSSRRRRGGGDNGGG